MYDYQIERAQIFTEEGQQDFLAMRDHVGKMLTLTSAFTMGKAIDGVVGLTYPKMAAVDRLVELREIREITGPGVAGQDRVFVAGRRR